MLVVSSPLDQFEVRNLLSLDAPILANIHLSITNIGLYLTIAASIVSTVNLLASNYNKIVSNSWSISQESIYATVHSIVVNQINVNKGQMYFPFIYALFIYILINNLVGMVPYSFASTSHFVLTFSISFVVGLGATILGFKKHGLVFFSLFVPAGCPLGLLPLLVLIEFISYLARNVSLGLRLSANILGFKGTCVLGLSGGTALGKTTSRYPWLTLQHYSDLLQTFLNRSYNSLEWCLNSPPKSHAFVSLPLQSSMFYSPSEAIKNILKTIRAFLFELSVVFYLKLTLAVVILAVAFFFFVVGYSIADVTNVLLAHDNPPSEVNTIDAFVRNNHDKSYHIVSIVFLISHAYVMYTFREKDMSLFLRMTIYTFGLIVTVVSYAFFNPLHLYDIHEVLNNIINFYILNSFHKNQKIYFSDLYLSKGISMISFTIICVLLLIIILLAYIIKPFLVKYIGERFNDYSNSKIMLYAIVFAIGIIYLSVLLGFLGAKYIAPFFNN